MNSEDNNSLWEAGLRRKLDAGEKARLQALLGDHPAQDAVEDLCLNAAMRRLENLPVSTNFSHRVMEAISREPAAKVRVPAIRGRWRLIDWLPKPVWIPLVVGIVFLSCQQYQSHSRRETAQSVAQLSHATSLVSVEVLQNFDAINRLGRTVPVDEALMAALK